MYNRYIPQNDGSYRRSTVRDTPVREPAAPPVCAPEESSPCVNCIHGNQILPPKPKRTQPPQSIPGFFRQLLPRELDTEDLIILLLLLLMAGDCREDSNTALLTLVLYLFL